MLGRPSFAPRRTPCAIVVKLNRVMDEALASDDVRRRFLSLGEEVAHGMPEAFGKLILEDYEKMGKLVNTAGIKVE